MLVALFHVTQLEEQKAVDEEEDEEGREDGEDVAEVEAPVLVEQGVLEDQVRRDHFPVVELADATVVDLDLKYTLSEIVLITDNSHPLP